MNKEELGERISDFLRDEDKELARSVYVEIRNYIGNFGQNDITLRAHYDGLSCSHLYSQNECRFTFRNRRLSFKLIENKIQVLQCDEASNTEICLDEIIVKEGKVNCKHGEFEVRHIDNYLTECYEALLS